MNDLKEKGGWGMTAGLGREERDWNEYDGIRKGSENVM